MSSSSSLEWNKIAGAVIIALLSVKVIGIVGEKVYHPRMLEKNVLEIEGVEAAAPSATPAAPAKPEPVSALLASADVDAGKKSFAKCLVCHTDDLQRDTHQSARSQAQGGVGLSHQPRGQPRHRAR